MEKLGMTADFWRGKRVFVTGHTGFKGSWLCLWLKQLGATVSGYALAPNTDPNLFDLAHVAQSVHSHICDIRDFDSLLAALKAEKPDIVFHLAAQPLVRLSYDSPRETYETNVMGTVNLLDAIRQVDSARSVVVVTSDKCYENREVDIAYRESDPMGGHDPYSSSKGCAELVTAAMRNSYFDSGAGARAVAIASARAGNVIGGGDWSADRLIPDVFRAIQAGKAVLIRRPGAIRPWQHVLEPLAGYLSLAEHLHSHGARYAGPWNFGPSEEDAKPVSWVVETLASQWGPTAKWERDAGEHPHEAHYLKLDSAKARSALGWRPVLALKDALQLTVNWQRAHESGQDMRAFTSEQIRQYQSTAG